MSADLIHGNDVVSIVFCFQIENERRVSDDPQRCRGKERSLVAMRSIFAQHTSRRPRAISQVVGHVVKQALNAMRSLQAAQLAEFGWGQAPGVVVRHPNFPVKTLLAASRADGGVT